MSKNCASGCVVTLAVVVVAAAGAAALWSEKGALTGKSWGITYTAHADQGGPMTVTYQDTKGRYLTSDRSIRQHTETVSRTEWTKEVMLAANRQAKITVRPAAGRTARCQILLDGHKVLAKGASPAPGQPAVCTADPE